MGLKRTLIVGSDDSVCRQIKDFIESSAISANLVLNYKEGLDRLFYEKPDIAILEVIYTGVSKTLLERINGSKSYKICDFEKGEIVRNAHPMFLIETEDQVEKLFAYLTDYLENNLKTSIPRGSDFQGEFKGLFFPRLLVNIYRENLTGILTVDSKVKVKIYFIKGIPVFAEGGELETALGRMLLDGGRINEEDYEKALEKGVRQGQRIGYVLIEMGIITPHELNSLLEQQVQEKILRTFKHIQGTFSFKLQDDFIDSIIAYRLNPLQLIYMGAKNYILPKYVEEVLFAKNDASSLIQIDMSKEEELNTFALSPKELRFVQFLVNDASIPKLLELSRLERHETLSLIYFLYLLGYLHIPSVEKIETTFWNPIEPEVEEEPPSELREEITVLEANKADETQVSTEPPVESVTQEEMKSNAEPAKEILNEPIDDITDTEADTKTAPKEDVEEDDDDEVDFVLVDEVIEEEIEDDITEHASAQPVDNEESSVEPITESSDLPTDVSSLETGQVDTSVDDGTTESVDQDISHESASIEAAVHPNDDIPASDEEKIETTDFSFDSPSDKKEDFKFSDSNEFASLELDKKITESDTSEQPQLSEYGSVNENLDEQEIATDATPEVQQPSDFGAATENLDEQEIATDAAPEAQQPSDFGAATENLEKQEIATDTVSEEHELTQNDSDEESSVSQDDNEINFSFVDEAETESSEVDIQQDVASIDETGFITTELMNDDVELIDENNQSSGNESINENVEDMHESSINDTSEVADTVNTEFASQNIDDNLVQSRENESQDSTLINDIQKPEETFTANETEQEQTEKVNYNVQDVEEGIYTLDDKNTPPTNVDDKSLIEDVGKYSSFDSNSPDTDSQNVATESSSQDHVASSDVQQQDSMYASSNDNMSAQQTVDDSAKDEKTLLKEEIFGLSDSIKRDTEASQQVQEEVSARQKESTDELKDEITDIQRELMKEIEDLYDVIDEKNYYEMLELKHDAIIDDIKATYFIMAKKFHPDRNKFLGPELRQKAESVFARISQAYDVLSNPEKRSDYDSMEDIESVHGQIKDLYEAEVAYKEGEILLKRKKYAEATKEMRKAFDLNPDEAAYLAALSWTRFLASPNKDKILNEVRYDLEKASILNSKCAEAYYYLGCVNKHSQNIKQAQRNFMKAVNCNPDYVEAKRELRFLDKLGPDKSQSAQKTPKVGVKKGKDKKFWSSIFKK